MITKVEEFKFIYENKNIKLSIDKIKKNAKEYVYSLLNSNNIIYEKTFDIISSLSLNNKLSNEKTIYWRKNINEFVDKVFKIIDDMDIREMNNLINKTKDNQPNWIVNGNYNVELTDSGWFYFKK